MRVFSIFLLSLVPMLRVGMHRLVPFIATLIITSLPITPVHANGKITVTLDGLWSQPGTYQIQAGSRVTDVIRAASGVKKDAFAFGARLYRLREAEEDKAFFKQARQRLSQHLSKPALKKLDHRVPLSVVSRLIAQIDRLVWTGRVPAQLDMMVVQSKPATQTWLQEGDLIVMPSRPENITVCGAVKEPVVLKHKYGTGVLNSLDSASIINDVAEKDDVTLIFPNGKLATWPVAYWNRVPPTDIPPGTTILVRFDDSLGETAELLNRLFISLVQNQGCITGSSR